MLETTQIFDRSAEQGDVIAHIPKRDVARATQKGANGVGLMIVVYVKSLSLAVTGPSLRLFAYGAEAVLSLQHLVVLCFRESVIRDQTHAAPGRAIAVMVALMGGATSLLSFFGRKIRSLVLIVLTNARATRAVFQNANIGLDVSARADGNRDIGLSNPCVVTLAHLRANSFLLFWGGIRPLSATRRATAFSAIPVFQRAYEILVVTVFAEVGRYTHSARRLSQFVAYDKVAIA